MDAENNAVEEEVLETKASDQMLLKHAQGLGQSKEEVHTDGICQQFISNTPTSIQMNPRRLPLPFSSDSASSETDFNGCTYDD